MPSDSDRVRQRPMGRGRQRLARRDHITNDDECRRRDAVDADEFAEPPEGALEDTLAGQRAILDHRDRRAGGASVRDQACGDRLDAGDPHVNRQRVPGPGQTRPIQLGLSRSAVAGDKGNGLGGVTVGKRDAGRRGTADGRRDSRDDLDRDPALGEVFELLAAAPEDEGIATLEPDDAPPLRRVMKEKRVDLVLGAGMPTGRLAHIDALGVAAREFDDLGPDQAIVHDDIGIPQQPQRTQRQQIWTARPGADDGHAASGRRDVCAHRRRHGLAGSRLIASEHLGGDRAVEEPLPEAAPRGRRDSGTGHRPERLGEAREPSKSVGQQPFDAGANPARQHRRRAAGRNGDNDGIAIDDRRRDEIRQVGPIDNVDRHAIQPRRPRHTRVDVVTAGRRVDHRAPLDIGRREGPRQPLDLAGPGACRDVALDDGRHHRHRRPGVPQQSDLWQGRAATADDQGALPLHVEERGQVSHGSLTGVLAPPAELPGPPSFCKAKHEMN